MVLWYGRKKPLQAMSATSAITHGSMPALAASGASEIVEQWRGGLPAHDQAEREAQQRQRRDEQDRRAGQSADQARGDAREPDVQAGVGEDVGHAGQDARQQREAPVHAVQAIGRQDAGRGQDGQREHADPGGVDVMNRLGGEADQDEERDAEGDAFVA